MPFVILPTNSISGGYDITNSLRYNPSSSDDLSRTPASSGDRQKWTYSVWVKKSDISNTQSILAVNLDGNNRFSFRLGEPDDFHLFDLVGGAFAYQIKSSASFRDVSAWYHFVIAFDTTQATDTNRVKIYVNGSQVTAFSTASYPSQNSNTPINNTVLHRIGSDASGDYFNGYLSEIYLIDGQQLTPSSFGETDTDTGIWKPKAYTGSFGTNGFYLQFKNSASLGTDSSGNGNTFTVNNLTSVDQSTDTPTNNFATLNPLALTTRQTLSDGNLTATASSWTSAISTIAFTTGKWFAEVKYVDATGAIMVGVMDEKDMSSLTGGTGGLGFTTNSVGYYKDGTKFIADIETSYGASYTTNDIIGIALDLDSGTKTVTFYKNGASQGAINLPTTGTGTFFIGTSSTNNGKSSINFGNPPYSGGSFTDGAGYGNFSYAVPSGYYSLNTKNLATFG
jgi:hypothetical protein